MLKIQSAHYIKTGSPESRRLNVFESADGSNLYMLEASSGGPMLVTIKKSLGNSCSFNLSTRQLDFAITAEGLVGASMNCSSTLENDPSPFYFPIDGLPTLDHPQMNGCPGLKIRDQGYPDTDLKSE
jgi:hypothetical protein